LTQFCYNAFMINEEPTENPTGFAPLTDKQRQDALEEAQSLLRWMRTRVDINSTIDGFFGNSPIQVKRPEENEFPDAEIKLTIHFSAGRQPGSFGDFETYIFYPDRIEKHTKDSTMRETIHEVDAAAISSLYRGIQVNKQ
jgi:hypothetical protein